jgi:hypothetical protein
MPKFKTFAFIVATMALAITFTPSSADARPASPAGGMDGPGAGGAVITTKVWAACGRRSADDKIVRTYDRYRLSAGGQFIRGGKSNLLCGTEEEFGYRHILAGHLGDWEKVALPTMTNWRDVADFSIAIVLIDPDKVTYDPKRHTFCLSRLIYLVNKRTGQTIGTKIPRVAIRQKDARVITAFPTNSQCGS